MHAALDSVLLGPSDNFLAWIELLDEWESLLTESPLSASCPTRCQQEVYEKWSDHKSIVGALAEQACPLDAYDLLRILDALLGRLHASPLPDGLELIVDGATCAPSYEPAGIDPRNVATMVEHLGSLAARSAETREDIGVITKDSSWSHPPGSVAVEGNVVMRQVGSGPLEDLESLNVTVRELLRVWRNPSEIMAALAEQPCQLMQHLEFGVRAYAVAVMGHKNSSLQIRFLDLTLQTVLRSWVTHMIVDELKPFCARWQCLRWGGHPMCQATVSARAEGLVAQQ
jgi:hypothetical protein